MEEAFQADLVQMLQVLCLKCSVSSAGEIYFGKGYFCGSLITPSIGAHIAFLQHMLITEGHSYVFLF